MSCPSCGATVPAGSRFCPSCGRALGGRSDERRIATVLFADIVGFTGLAEHGDPEQVKRLVDACFERLAQEVTAFGGTVDKVVGDALVALFGAPVAHGDDAERAVRAALRMPAAMAEFTNRAGAPLQVRVGVNTGEVLVGTQHGGGDYTAMGDVVNTAQRLQTSAAPGEVVVGPQTHDATHDVISYRPLGRLEARGREGSVESWCAVEAALPPGHRPPRAAAPLTGREDELAVVDGAISLAVRRRRSALVLLSGEIGIGTSRVAGEAAETARRVHGARVLEGRCIPYGEANVWWPLAEAVRSACGVGAEEDRVGAERCVRVTVAELEASVGDVAMDPERLATGLVHLLDYEGPLREIEPQRAREEVRWAVLSFLELLARVEPLVIVLSDLHWADPAVLELLDALVDHLARCPFVVVGTSGEDLTQRWTRSSERSNSVIVALDPLDRSESRRLFDALVEHEVPEDLAEAVVDRSGGNPLFLEELVALLAQGGPARRGLVAAPGETSWIPDTLRGLITARIDGLAPPERSLVQAAAVWGRSGQVEVLEHMARHLPGFEVATDLPRLVAADVLDVSGARWSFRSALVREVAYETLTKADRARRHAGIALFFVERRDEPEHAGSWVLGVVAHHYGAAAELVVELGSVPGVPDEVVDAALRWLEAAARRAESSLLPLAAERLFDQALRLDGRADSDDARRTRLLLGRAGTRGALRRLDEAVQDVEEANRLAAALADPTLVARTRSVEGELLQKRGELIDADAVLVDAADRFAALGDEEGEAGALRALGLTRIFAGDRKAAEEAIEQAMALSRTLGDLRGEGWALQHLAWISFVEGRSGEASTRLEASAAMFTELGDRGGLGWALGLLGFVEFYDGNVAEAGRIATDLLDETRERGDRWGQGMLHLLLAGVQLWSGAARRALEEGREAVRVLDATGDRVSRAQASAVLARALVTVGSVEEGLGTLEAGNEPRRPLPSDRDVRLATSTARAGIFVHLGEPEQAIEATDEIGGSGEAPAGPGELDRLVARALALLQLGQAEESYAAASEIVVRSDPPSTYAVAVAALAGVATGRPVEEVEVQLSRASLGERGSYLDAAYARLAVAVARCVRNDATGMAHLDELDDEIARTDDRVTVAVIATARHRVLEAAGRSHEAAALEARRRWADLRHDGHGWDRAVRSLVAGSR